MDTLERYEPSGSAGSAWLPLLAGATVAAAGVAWVYQRIVDWIPLIYVSFLATLGFGMLLGLAAREVVRRGEVRSRSLALVTTVVLVLGAWAASFYWDRGFFAAEVYDGIQEALDAENRRAERGGLPRGPDAPETGPREMPITREQFVERFTFEEYHDWKKELGWSIGHVGTGGGGLQLTGLLVYAIWLTEAGILLYVARKAPAKAADRPYCERCGTWAARTELRPAAGVRPEDVAAALERGDWAAAANPPAHPGSHRSVVYAVHACPTCGEAAWLDVAGSETKTNSKGKVEQVLTPLAVGAVLTRDQRRVVEEARARAVAPAASPTAAPPP
jgi:hypothetical protein